MMMLYAVRMRLVFISSVTAMTPLRTISVTTGSIFALRGRFFVALRFIATWLLRLDIRELDHFGPLLGLAGIDLLVELIDDLRRRALRRADAVEGHRLVARYEFGHRRHVGQSVGALGGGHAQRAELAGFDVFDGGRNR